MASEVEFRGDREGAVTIGFRMIVQGMEPIILVGEVEDAGRDFSAR